MIIVIKKGTGSEKYAIVGAAAQHVTAVVKIRTIVEASDSEGTLSSIRIIDVVIIPPIENTIEK